MALPESYHSSLALGVLPDKDLYSEDEYFAFEERALTRWEFAPAAPNGPGGFIRAMSGGTPEHSAIAANLIAALVAATRAAGKRTCRTFGSDLKVHTGSGLNTYPDASVVCGKLDHYRSRQDILTNPILLAEVHSPSTAAYDRGEKWESYQTIPVLEHALIVSADEARVELWTREGQGWRMDDYTGLDTNLPLPKLGLTLTMADIYAQVEFAGDIVLEMTVDSPADGMR